MTGFDTDTVTAQGLSSWQTRRTQGGDFQWPPVETFAGHHRGLSHGHGHMYRGLLPDDYLDSLSIDARVRSWTQRLRTGSRVLLAEREARLVGFVSYGSSRDEDAAEEVGELYAIYVQPQAWGTGVGRALHDATVRSLSAGGLEAATLWVLDGNERARDFYAGQGWRPDDGGVKTDERPGATLTEVRYRRHLRDSNDP